MKKRKNNEKLLNILKNKVMKKLQPANYFRGHKIRFEY